MKKKIDQRNGMEMEVKNSEKIKATIRIYLNVMRLGMRCNAMQWHHLNVLCESLPLSVVSQCAVSKY